MFMPGGGCPCWAAVEGVAAGVEVGGGALMASRTDCGIWAQASAGMPAGGPWIVGVEGVAAGVEIGGGALMASRTDCGIWAQALDGMPGGGAEIAGDSERGGRTVVAGVG